MYEELVKRLREIHPEEFGDAWDFAFACQQSMHEAADAIEQLQKKYDGAVSDNKSLCRQIAELAKKRNEAYSDWMLLINAEPPKGES